MERAIQLNPNYATAHYHYSYLLAEQKRFDEAIHEATEAMSREPTSALLNAGLAFVSCWHVSTTIASSRP